MSVQVGGIYGRLTVLSFSHRDVRSRSWWHCSCQCGGTTTIRQDVLLRTGRVHSCGCIRRSAGVKHGGSYTSTYQTWRAMRKRCNDPKNVSYPNYGGRGVRVCDEWNDPQTGFARFLADVGPRPHGMTLDRKNSDLDYSPDNCRWASKLTQEWNKRGKRQASEDAAEWAHWDEEEAAYLASADGLTSDSTAG